MTIRLVSKTLVTLTLVLASVTLVACGGAESRRASHMAKGKAFLAAENYDKARIEFQNALQIAPKDAEARFEMGVVEEKLGKPREAANFYQGTIDIDAQHLGARTNLARLYLFSGVPDRAMDLIAPAIERHPSDPALLTIRAAVRMQQKDETAAKADADRAVHLAPDNEDAVAILAGIYNSTGATDKAQSLLEETIQRVPNSVDLRLILANVYEQLGRHAEEEALLIKLVELKPHEKAHRVRLAQFYSRANQPEAAERTLRAAIKELPQERDLKFSLVSFLAASRGREVAEKELQAMIAAQPQDTDLKFGLASFYVDGKELAKAEAVYQGVIDDQKLNPPGLVARDRLATLRVQRNDLSGALNLVNQVLEKSPRDDDALFVRGQIALSKQDPRTAIADLRAVLRDQPNSVGVLRALAQAHLANGEPSVAEETMRHAVDANPKDVSLRLEFAQLLARIGKADQAKPLLADVVKEHPDNVNALDLQYRVALTSKDFALAKNAAEAITALRPKSAVGLLYQGQVAEGQNRKEDALKFYAAAVELQPDAPEALQSEIRLLVNDKRVDEALRRADAFTNKYAKSPLGPEVQGEILLSKSKNAESQAAFETAITRSPKWWMPYRGLAHAQLAANNPNGAIETLRKGEDAVEQGEALGAELASMLETQGKTNEAIDEYEKLLKRYPQSDVLANNLAMLLASHRSDQASLERAKQLSMRFAESSNVSYLDTYGWVLFKRGEAAASVPVLTRVVAKVPDEPVARYHLGMALALAGNNTEARDNLSRAVNSKRSFLGMDEARATLEKLPKNEVLSAASPKT